MTMEVNEMDLPLNDGEMAVRHCLIIACGLDFSDEAIRSCHKALIEKSAQCALSGGLRTRMDKHFDKGLWDSFVKAVLRMKEPEKDGAKTRHEGGPGGTQ